MTIQKTAVGFVMFVGLMIGMSAPGALAATAEEIQAGMDVTLERLTREVRGADQVLKKAQGVLVFPEVWKAGIGIGGEYGEGALQVKGKIVDYYSIVGASLGFQLGVQKKAVILAFMDADVFGEFRYSEGWEVGVNGSVALIKVGVDGSIDSLTHNESILTFVIGQKGLMYNLSIEGSKLTKIKKD